MKRVISQLVAALAIVVSVTSIAAGSASARNHSSELRRDLAGAAYGSVGGQAVQGTGVGSTLRVTVLDQTDAALIIAQVAVVDSRGVEPHSRITLRSPTTTLVSVPR